MGITKEELEKLIEVKADIDEVSKISNAGDTLSIRLPKEVIETLKLKKGNKIRWLEDIKTKKLEVEIRK